MCLRLTPDVLGAAYDYLRHTRPFKAMRIPESDDVAFVVSRRVDRLGHYTRECGKPDSHEIHISESSVGSTSRLMEVMAHEMLHLYQDMVGTSTKNTAHNAEFRRIAKRICSEHVFDPKAFF